MRIPIKNEALLSTEPAPPESTISLIQLNTNQINIKRISYFFFGMLIIEPFIILLFDLEGLLQSTAQEAWIDASYFVLHLSLWLISLCWILALKQNTSKIALLLLDIDFFKQINDQYGHLVGDQVLIHIAQMIENAVPDSFTVSRWGGEEFLVAGPVVSLEQALNLAEMIRAQIAIETYPSTQGEITITTSLGVSLITGDCIKNFDHYFKQADDALYQAKANGRNRVEHSVL
ncbi:GGDEF domain-containing protein [Acetobacterium wieringae]|uniref:GGDEF domain-containing protein n=1 Tax=Acetobacterium wieringae TaxID=52694 RepID=A0ABY6HCA9_9FIRM|nr:GGDEF domain-containing protein [Acetobacterium wieringae]UYO61246.1 GGDEF domain-containing protein [Acetobacterium wieringae]